MRVICINEKWISPDHWLNEPSPVFLEECVVDRTGYIMDEFSGNLIPAFTLVGYVSDTGFAQMNFAILPEQTADEMQELEKEAIIK